MSQFTPGGLRLHAVAEAADVRVPRVDWDLVAALRHRAAAEIARECERIRDRSGRVPTAEDRRALGAPLVRRLVAGAGDDRVEQGQAPWHPAEEDAHVRALNDALFGWGRLQPVLEVGDAENIEITGCDEVHLQYADGRRVRTGAVAASDAELVEALRFLGESATPSRPFDEAHPTMTLALGEEFRLHAIGFGLAHRPSVTIRRHRLRTVTLPDLVRGGMLEPELARLLHAAVLARRSIVISGDQNAGKTTLLRALVAAIPITERFGTIETDYELMAHHQPGRHHVLALQARLGMGERLAGERLGEVTVADLIPEALRQNLARIVVGEVRGAEAGAMIEAMQAGAGTLSTTHAHSAAATLDRLASRAALGGALGHDEALRQLAHHVEWVVHLELVDDTWRGGRRVRRVSEVRRCTGALEGGRPVTHTVFTRAGGEVRFDPGAEVAADLGPWLAAIGPDGGRVPS